MIYAFELAAIALSYDGCSAGREPERFAELVAPDDDREVGRFFCRIIPGAPNSSCGVAAVGFLRLLLRRYGRQELDGSLMDGRARPVWWARATALAQVHGAWMKPGGGRRPGIGSIVHVRAPHGQHWFTVVGMGDDGISVSTIDGGQVDERGYQEIRRCDRRIPPTATVEFVSGKPIVEWIDTETLMRSLVGPSGATPSCPAA